MTSTQTMKLAAAGAMVAVTLLAAAAAEGPAAASIVATKEGVPGGVKIDAVKVTATVTDLDAANRLITIQRPDAEKRTFKAGPEVANFDQIRVGDKVVLTVAEALVVYMNKAGEPTGAGAATTVDRAARGEKPGLLVTDTVSLTATVKAIDLERHAATLEFPDGSTKTVTAREDVDLTKVKVGETLTIRMTQAMAIRVEKPTE